jgi:hypothetical protein
MENKPRTETGRLRAPVLGLLMILFRAMVLHIISALRAITALSNNVRYWTMEFLKKFWNAVAIEDIPNKWLVIGAYCAGTISLFIGVSNLFGNLTSDYWPHFGNFCGLASLVGLAAALANWTEKQGAGKGARFVMICLVTILIAFLVGILQFFGLKHRDGDGLGELLPSHQHLPTRSCNFTSDAGGIACLVSAGRTQASRWPCCH